MIFTVLAAFVTITFLSATLALAFRLLSARCKAYLLLRERHRLVLDVSINFHVLERRKTLVLSFAGRKFIKCRVQNVALQVRRGDILACGDGNNILISLREFIIIFHKRAHSRVVQFVRQNNRALFTSLADNFLIVFLHLALFAQIREFPIIRVLLPDNRAVAKSIRNGTNAIINITEGRTPASG